MLHWPSAKIAIFAKRGRKHCVGDAFPCRCATSNLTKHIDDFFDDFVAREVKKGDFQNASEAVRAGPQLLEQKTREDAE